ncbi:MAG: adenylate/guanylate cyclase domain-containing protein [Chloroflexota bacterium]|nr:adenylate/guanylate cyclase domain-containing protein [Chloroflexota bacterium]
MTHVLIIDSDTDTHRIVEQLRPDLDDLSVASPLTAEEGLRLAVESKPDLILLSADLPDQSSLQALPELHESLETTPIIVVAERESADQAVRAFRWGACDYVRKPLDSYELRQAITRALDTTRPSEERDRLARKLLEATKELQRQQQELNAIHVIGRLTTSLLDLDVVLDRLTEIAVHLTEAEESVLLLRDQDTDELYLQTSKNLSAELNGGFRMTMDGMGPGRAVRTGRPVLVTGDQARITPGSQSRATLYMPVQAQDRVIGLLGLSSRQSEDAFSQRDVFLLSNLVDYAAIAIENARLFESTASAKLLMDNVFWSIASGVITLDHDNRISLINRAARQMLQAPDAQTGAHLADALPMIDATLKPLIEQVRRDNQPKRPLEIDLSLPSGQLVNLRMTLSPLRQGTRPLEGVTVVMEDLTRQRKLESRFRLFQRYLSPTVIERLPDDPQELELGGVRQEIACLFADLRGFVNFSMRHPPEALVDTLNKYLGVGAEAVLDQEGTLDKFVGDAVVAFFNAPLVQEDYALRAVRAALTIRERTRELHGRLAPDHWLAYGIGISVGEAIVGNIGTPQRLDYTAIGPSVNIANRLQGAAKPGQILITPEVYQQTQDHIRARPLLLEGVPSPQEKTQAFELLGLS